MSLKRLQNICLFQKNGEIIDLEYNEELDLLQGDLVFRKTSVGLLENQSVYFCERVSLYDEIDYDDIRSFRQIDAYVHENRFQFFDVSPYTDGDPEIIIRDSFSHVLREDKTCEKEDNIVNIRERFGTPPVLQVLIDPREEGYIEDILVIKLDGEIAIELTMSVYVEGEDERFINRLADFGEYLTKDDAYIFRNHPLDDDVADVSILNRKRKEFLLEMHNIKPYFSSAKGVRGILNLFDFQDLKIKEFWLNPKNGKLVHEDLSGKILDYSSLQKTSKFGLFFEYNSVVPGKYDEHGLPVTKDNFLFTTDEIIIKLFGLRRWIEEREIGGISDIVDIVGEFVFFNKYKVTTSFQERETLHVSSVRTPQIVATRPVFYLEDRRNNTEYFANPKLRDNPKLSDIKSVSLGSIGDSILGASYKYTGFDDTFTRGGVKSNVYAHVVLENLSFNKRIGDMTTSYSSFIDIPATYSTINHHGYYRGEVVLSSNGHLHSTYNFPIDSPTIDIFIQHSGIFDVTVVYHHAGGKDIFSKKNMFEVRQKIPNFLAFFKSHPSSVVRQHNKMSEARLRFISSKIHEYERLHFLGNSNLGFRRMNYSSSDFKIVDFGLRSWDDLDLSGVRYPSLRIYSFSTGKYSLSCDHFSISGEMKSRDTIVNLYEDIRHKLDTEDYNVIFRDWETPYIEIVFKRMVYGNINLKPTNIDVKWMGVKDYPFRWNNTNIYEESFFITPFHPVFFSTDESYIDGISNANWKITDKNGNVVVYLVNSPVFCYTFQEIGNYTVECEIFDNMGNYSKCVKHNMVQVVSAKDYERYIRYVK